MKHGSSPKISDVKADFQTFMDLSGGSPQNVMYKLHGKYCKIKSCTINFAIENY